MTAVPYTIYDKLPVVDQAAIVFNKRLGHVLRIAQELQKKRDNRRSLDRPAHTNTGASPVQTKRGPGTKPARSLNLIDLVEAIEVKFVVSMASVSTAFGGYGDGGNQQRAAQTSSSVGTLYQ